MASVIKVENLSKQYRLGKIGTGSLSHDLNRWWHIVRGKENPYLKIGDTNDRSTKGESEYVWSLKDINFEIEQGDAVGIIGKNGAGKSTLLKILSRVTGPTTGSLKVKGRIASLLEVGTGFHPELSGRENIFLNGAILGMRKHEIKRKFDEIVDFSGVERYIDTPVKRYSSGMYVRLAFAVAAHLESEILIVDEVLAVGDAEFQKKCLGKMGDVSKGEGRTVLFVSHNMNAVQNLCKKSILLKNGILESKGDTLEIISRYLSDNNSSNSYEKDLDSNLAIQILKARIEKQDFKKITIEIEIFSKNKSKCSIDFRISNSMQDPFAFGSIGALDYRLYEVKEGNNKVKVLIEIDQLAIGSYYISVDLTYPNVLYYDSVDNCINFEVIKNTNLNLKRDLTQDWNYGCYHIPTSLIMENSVTKS